MKRLLFLGALIASVLAVRAAPAPMLIPFQGRLTDQQARAYTSGQYTITFVLYDQAVGGTPLWTETHQRVGVINGMVNVFLGSIQPFDAASNPQGAVSFSDTRHLGITIDADNNQNTPDPEMVPRQMIIPSFWSKHADNSAKLAGNDWSAILVDRATNPVTGRIDGGKLGDRTVTQAQIGDGQINTRTLVNGAITRDKLEDGSVGTTKLANGAVTAEKIAAAVQFVPPGTIVAFAGPVSNDRVPLGWLLCDGAPIPTAGYPNLYAAIGDSWGSPGPGLFNLPDLRGNFLRGVDESPGQGASGRDPDRTQRKNSLGVVVGPTVGSYQGDEFKNHNHDNGINNKLVRNDGNSTTRSTDFTPGEIDTITSAPILSAGGNETRPKNAYVNYIIKL